MSQRMPALFVGHGNPMNALLVNPYTQRWAALGTTLPGRKRYFRSPPIGLLKALPLL